MKSKKEIKALLRNTENSIEFERGRLNVLNEQAKDVEASKGAQNTIYRLQAIADAYRTVLNVSLK